MLLPEKIVQSNASKDLKIIYLWIIIELNYRLPYGELANDYLAKLMDVETKQALFFLTGVMQGMFGQAWDFRKLQQMCPPYDPKEALWYNTKGHKL